MNLLNEKFDNLQFGDIVFVANPNTVIGKLTDAKQNFKSVTINGSNVKPTHVAIAWGEGRLIFHAVKSGIKFAAIPKYVSGKRADKGEVFIFRNFELEKKLLADYKLIIELRNYFTDTYFGKKYNKGVAFRWKSNTGSKFCSELAVEFLRDYNFIEQTIKPHKILPIDLIKICLDAKKWKPLNLNYGMLYDEKIINKAFTEKINKTDDPKIKEMWEDSRTIAIRLAKTLANADRGLAHVTNIVERIDKKLSPLKKITTELNQITKTIRKRK